MKSILLSTLFLFILMKIMGQIPTTALLEKELNEHQEVNYSALCWAKTQGINNKKVKLDSIWTKYQKSIGYKESKEYYRYNSKGQFIETITRHLNSRTGKWENIQKTEFLFDTITNTTTKNHYLSDTLNNWFMNFISTQQVDNLNHMTIEKYWTIQPDSGISHIKEMYYNSDELISTILEYYHFDSISQTFKTRGERNYLYNNNLQLIELKSAVYDNISNKLRYANKTLYSYSNDSLLNKEIYYSWDSISLNWKPYSKYTYKYDSNGNLLERTTYNYDANTWSEHWKSNYVYDINNNRTFKIAYWNNNISKLWEPDYKWEQIYDNNYESEELLLPQAPMYRTGYDLLSNKHIVSNRKHYEYFNGSWRKYDEHTFYYSNLNNARENIYYETDIRVYPNPTSDYIMIELKNSYNNSIIYIYDAQGNMVIQHNLSNDKKINVRSLSQGVYLFSVKSENKVFTGKFTILR